MRPCIPLWTLLELMLTACDQDPFDLRERRVTGDYRLDWCGRHRLQEPLCFT